MSKQEFSSVSGSVSRRSFLKKSTFGAGALFTFGSSIMALPVKAAKLKGGEKLNIACMGGGGGKGSSDCDEFVKLGENIVAICDVDSDRANKKAAALKEKFPNIKVYQDYRKCLEEMGDQIDACTVSTPDHMHAPISMAAMEMGKHVYTQKPLTWCVGESRAMKAKAKEKGLTTQMGNQGSGHDSLRRGVELVHAGIIGEVKEIQAWTNRPVWPTQGKPRAEGEDPVPANLAWDLWLGVAPKRPYKDKIYHSFNWRGFKDFGGGALADMACHLWNFPFRALKLGYPSSCIAENSDNFEDTFPANGKVTFEFPAREGLPPMKLVWREGGQKPADDEVADLKKFQLERAKENKLPNNGVVLIGSKGVIYQRDDYGGDLFLKLKDDATFTSISKHEACSDKIIPITIPRTKNHYGEWSTAAKAGKTDTYSRFEIAGFLTETILVGCLAQRLDKQKIEWNGEKAECTNLAAANEFVNRKYRTGW